MFQFERLRGSGSESKMLQSRYKNICGCYFNMLTTPSLTKIEESKLRDDFNIYVG